MNPPHGAPTCRYPGCIGLAGDDGACRRADHRAFLTAYGPPPLQRTAYLEARALTLTRRVVDLECTLANEQTHARALFLELQALRRRVTTGRYGPFAGT